MTAATGLPPGIPAAALRDVACGLCGESEREVRFTDGPFAVVRCASCGLVYVTPRLDDASLIDGVYGESYWRSREASTHGYTDYRADAPLYLETYRKRLAVVRRHFDRPGRVLDVGCAAGYFLEVMREEGWDVFGLEPSAPIRAHAEERLGSERVSGALLHEAPFEEESFDLVTMWDVLEHVPDPVGVLRAARRMLRPEGRLLVETQNVESRAAKLLGRRWQHYKHAEHLYHFSPATLADALGRAGFRVLENSPRLGGKVVSMGFVAERASRLHPALSTLLKPLARLRGARVYVNLFDEMVVVACTEPASHFTDSRRFGANP